MLPVFAKNTSGLHAVHYQTPSSGTHLIKLCAPLFIIHTFIPTECTSSALKKSFLIECSPFLRKYSNWRHLFIHCQSSSICMYLSIYLLNSQEQEWGGKLWKKQYGKIKREPLSVRNPGTRVCFSQGMYSNCNCLSFRIYSWPQRQSYCMCLCICTHHKMEQQVQSVKRALGQISETQSVWPSN